MVIYCEGAKSAEIIFSLTGGREGRLISYAPPVEITYPVSGIYCQHVLYEPGTYDVNENLGSFVLKDRATIPVYNLDVPLWQDFKENGAPTQYAYKYFITAPQIDSNNVVSFRFVIQERNEQTGIIKTIHTSRVLRGGEGVGNIHFVKYVDKALLIEDMNGVLYFYQIPEGFTPTWQVNCIGCNPDECAGSDGKGGVVCMDCKQMNNDLKTIKKSLGG